MKKLVLAAAIMMLVPFSAFALDSMNDDALDKMTAQEGVTITFDNVVINQTPADVAWRDSDGVGVGTTAGRVFVNYAEATATTGFDVITVTKNMTIDVATVAAGATYTSDTGAVIDNSAVGATAKSFVKVGLPSVSIGAKAKTMTIGMDGLAADAALPATGILGTLFQDSGSSTVSGAIFISAH